MPNTFLRREVPITTAQLRSVYVMPQQQRSNPNVSIGELSSAIRGDKAIDNPFLIAELTPRQFDRYAAMCQSAYFGELGSARHAIRQLNNTVWVLVAGERRLLANERLVSEGVEVSKKAIIFTPENQRPDLMQLLITQARENTHVRPDALCESGSIIAFWRLLKKDKPATTFVGLSKALDKLYSPERIANAVKFHDLPQFVHEHVHEKRLSYSAAVELNRLHDAGIDDKWFKALVNQAVAWSFSARQVRKKTLSIIELHKKGESGQHALFELSTDDIVQAISCEDKELTAKHASQCVRVLQMYINERRRQNVSVEAVYKDSEILSLLVQLGVYGGQALDILGPTATKQVDRSVFEKLRQVAVNK